MPKDPLNPENVQQFGWLFEAGRGKMITLNVIRKGACGMPEINVHHDGTCYALRLDFSYLNTNSEVYGQVPECLQVVFDNPQDMDADPVQHVRVWPDGSVKAFEC